MWLWVELCLAFNEAYEEPRDEAQIARTYEYAEWCLAQEARDRRADHDLCTCVAVAFYEHIPTHPEARADMPRWFSRADVLELRPVFSYLLDDGEFERLLDLFPPQSNRRTRRQSGKRRAQAPGDW